MANNRLLLWCARCDNEVTIARLQVGMDQMWLPSRVPAEEYEAWLAKHSVCHDGDGLDVRLVSENELHVRPTT